jgi:hypothetical protein
MAPIIANILRISIIAKYKRITIYDIILETNQKKIRIFSYILAI